MCATASFLATGGFVLFHDFSMNIQGFFSNSMIFPCMDFVLVIFHDFQSMWEPCKTDKKGH